MHAHSRRKQSQKIQCAHVSGRRKISEVGPSVYERRVSVEHAVVFGNVHKKPRCVRDLIPAPPIPKYVSRASYHMARAAVVSRFSSFEVVDIILAVSSFLFQWRVFRDVLLNRGWVVEQIAVAIVD